MELLARSAVASVSGDGIERELPMTRDTNLHRLQRLLEITEGPLERIRRQYAIADSLLHRDPSTVHMLERMQQPTYTTALHEHLETINRRSALFEPTQSVLARPAMLEQLEALTNLADETQRLSDRTFLPDRHSLTLIAESMAKQVNLFKTAGLTEPDWAQLLSKQMAAMQTPWLDADLASLSFEGFAVISRLGRAVRHSEPYDEAAREQIDQDLGDPIQVEDDAGPDERDAAHMEAEMNPAMLTISPAALSEVFIETGFSFKSKFAPLPPTTDGSDPGHVFHPGNNMLITAVEQNLRAAIDSKMKAKYGATWMESRIEPSLLKEWIVRRDDAVAHGESPLPLIQYTNFMELKDIVMRRQHWREVFADIFGKKEHFQTSMERLHPIRLPLAHSRPIGTGQQFHLISEASHILRSLGVDIFEGE